MTKRFLSIGLVLTVYFGVLGSSSRLLWKEIYRADHALASAAAAIPQDLLKNVPKTTVITDRHGEILYYLYKDVNRLVVPGSAIPSQAKDAFIAAEDERFYSHNGFDATSIARAIKENYQNKNIVSGGSTLTMQLVKNLTGDDRPTVERKLKEVYQAFILEERYSKEDILTAYLNVVPLGNTIAGVETASQFYYHKPAKELSVAESATLAALPTAPSFYYEHPDALVRRRNYVLRRMVETGKISQQQADQAMTESTALAEPITPLRSPHFVMATIDQLTKEYGASIYQKGLTVTTTLDIPTQMKAEQTIKENLSVLQTVAAQNVASVAIDPKTGQVLAMVGSKDYYDQKNDGEVNLALAPYSPGSTGKPLIYSFLLEKEHWSPGAIMWDVKTQFPIQGEKPYIPRNYDDKFMGPITLRQAIGNSRNIPAIKALQMVGLETALKRLPEFGITSLSSDPSQYGPSLAVGGCGIPLVEMTAAYSAFANEGKVNPAQLILKATDYSGRVIKEAQPTNRPVIKPEVAYEIADILQDNEARKKVFGPRSPLVIDGHHVGVKTGTAENYTSALTIGFTPDIVFGVIVANNDNSPLRAGGSGAMAAAPFFNGFMKSYLANKPDSWLDRPTGIKQTEFPTVIGKINDLVADWQSPTDRFNRRVAEIDNPLWNQAISRVAEKPAESSVITRASVAAPEPNDQEKGKKKEKTATKKEN